MALNIYTTVFYMFLPMIVGVLVFVLLRWREDSAEIEALREENKLLQKQINAWRKGTKFEHGYSEGSKQCPDEQCLASFFPHNFTSANAAAVHSYPNSPLFTPMDMDTDLQEEDSLEYLPKKSSSSSAPYFKKKTN
jgi:hypothetical protein